MWHCPQTRMSSLFKGTIVDWFHSYPIYLLNPDLLCLDQKCNIRTNRVVSELQVGCTVGEILAS